jgi:16S rRNA (guanine(527)-N(7))-methyltransferase RsmG
MIFNQTTVLRNLLTASKDFAERTLSAEQIEQLVGYYALVLKWNRALHLTTITQPEEFKRRHLVESLLVAEYLSLSIREAWDLGSGLGIPGVPLAICEPTLQVKLVEANHKKAIFLQEVAAELKLKNVEVDNCRFENLADPTANVALLARAIDKMEIVLPQILQLGKNAGQLLILCAGALAKIVQQDTSPEFKLRIIAIPNSQNRFLINAKRFT